MSRTVKTWDSFFASHGSQTYATLKKDTFQLSSFQELMDYASLEVNKKKKKEIGEYV